MSRYNTVMQTTFSLWGRFHRFVQPYLGTFICAISFGVFATALSLLPPALSRVMFDVAFPTKNSSLFVTLMMALCVVALLRFAIGAVNDLIELYLSEEIGLKITQNLFAKLSHLPLSFVQHRSPGDLLIRLTDDVHHVKNLLLNLAPTVLMEGGKLIALTVILWLIHPTLTLLVLAAFPLYYLETRFFARELSSAQSEQIQQEAGVLTRMQEQLQNMRTIKVFCQEALESKKLGKNLTHKYRASLVTRSLDILNTLFHSVTLQLWMVFLVWYLGTLILRGTLSLGDAVAFLLYTEMLTTPVQNLLSLAVNVSTSAVSMRRLDEILTAQGEEQEHFNPEPFKITNGVVSTENLSCSYHEHHPALDHVHLELQPHSLTALVGKSGSGKTTIANLLLRLIPPHSGAISIDGVNIHEVAVHSLREQVCMVEQESVLFAGTVLENLLYGNPEKNKEDALHAAKQAGALEFIEHLPEGFDTEVGVNGNQLSAGERQRISIARALLRDPKIIIFDESTSALDAESELAIQDTLQQLRLSKTLLVITHRLATLHAADHVVMLDEGKIVEQGTFENLMQKKDQFFWFYWAQFGGLGKLKEHLELEFERAKRYGSNYALASVRVEPEKFVNFSKEHLNELERHLKLQVRFGDQVAFWKNNIILLLLPEMDREHLLPFLHRTQELVNNWQTHDGKTIPCHYHLAGVAVQAQPWASSSELLHNFSEIVFNNTQTIACLEEQQCHALNHNQGKEPHHAL